jgi:hypothetical protein
MTKATAATLGLCAALSICARLAVAQGYTFTKIADSTLNNLDPDSLGAPSISDLGHVAFSARSSDQTVSRVYRTGPALAAPLTIIGDDSVNTDIGSFFSTVSVNNAGQVAVWATVSSPGLFERIVRGDGGPLETIAEAGNNRPFNYMSVVVSINDQGTVAWQGELNQTNGPQGLFTGNAGQPNTIFSTASSTFRSSFAGPAINNAGQVAFRASTTTSGGDAIFRYDGGANFVTIGNSSGPLSAAFDDEPAINSSGRVVVIGRNDNLSIVYLLVGDGTAPPVPRVDTVGALESITAAGINDSNQIAYLALFDDFMTQGIFTGPDLVNDRVIQTGASLEGSTVTRLSMFREGLNNSGQIAFAAQLANGRGVIEVATPIQSTGACCAGTACAVQSAAACTGSFRGVGTTCEFAGNPVTCCGANFNRAGGVTVQDVFDFIAAYFGNDAAADVNGSGAVTVQDIFDFLGLYFAGCAG